MATNQKNEVILHFYGPLQYDTIGQLINLLKDKSSAMDMKLVLFKKILLVMIETLENILKYNEHFEKDTEIRKMHLPRFTIEHTREGYLISSGNPILNSDVPELNEKLLLINSLNSIELKQLYKNTITNGQFSSKGGAGLGFIEIAKIAAGKIDYSFQPINEVYSYYRLKVIIREEPA